VSLLVVTNDSVNIAITLQQAKETRMKSLDELRAEHDGIKLMLKILSAIVDQAEKGGQVDTDHLNQIMEFMMVFVDNCHHGKEEELLFPALTAAGVPLEGGPVGVMLHEHTLGRRSVQAMFDALADYKAGDEKAIQDFAANARQYINLLNAHIDKENNVLYPMGEKLLSNETDARLLEGFETIEHDRIGEGKHEQFHEMLQRLKNQYL
jgi:hemerythrin-like domain-containing protein